METPKLPRIDITRALAVQPWKCSERPAGIKRPEDTRAVFAGAFPTDSREAFVGLMLDARHRPMAAPWIISIGSLNASLVHPREVFGPAILHRAAALIVAHNHPSGDERPSGDDLELTGRLDRAGEILGIALLDHLIFAVGDIHGEEPASYTSIREYGWPSRPAQFSSDL